MTTPSVTQQTLRVRPGYWLMGLALLLLSPTSWALPELADYTADLRAETGYYNFYFAPETDQVYLRVPRQTEPFIFQSSLPRGVGSNDLGLDRGQLGQTRLAEFSVHGNRVLLNQLNTDYRADTGDQPEYQSVREAFAESVLFGFEVVAASEEAVLINYTPFLYTDIHGLEQRLERLEEGRFQPDPERSVLWPERMRAFPDNTELEARVTYTGTDAGPHLRSVTPDAQAVTVHLHHSLIALPEPGYEPRAFHPQSGFYARGFKDYAAPLQEPMEQRFIARHRLQKKDPAAAVSEPVEPIIYYLDPGVPEPVRSALLDGARWWAEGFAAIGFENAFKVKELPADADPMDVRYNVIQWVHRSTRGWSYGASVADPRTGEILKGHVSLGSLRVRQDMLLAQGILAPYGDDADTPEVLEQMEEMALQRIRQLSAHEIGHTLGIAHNFAANSQDRASVMDYPHPLIELDEDGQPALPNAYDTGLGSWDKFTVAYGYTEFADAAAEEQGLAQLIQQARERGYDFISDRDARPVSSSHPTAHLWNNGPDAAAELNRLREIRRIILDRFGLANLAPGEPLDTLEQVLVPMYLLHRYQTEAAVKLIGGTHYRYYVKGEDEIDYRPVSHDQQQAALAAVLATLTEDFLAIPDELATLLVPKAYGSEPSREDFQSRMGLNPDPVTMAESSAHHTLRLLLNPERMNRLGWQQRLGEVTGPAGVLRELVQQVLEPVATDAGPIGQRVAYLTLYKLTSLQQAAQLAPEVRAAVESVLADARQWLQQAQEHGAAPGYLAYLQRRLEHFETEGQWPDAYRPAEMPPGSPI